MKDSVKTAISVNLPRSSDMIRTALSHLAAAIVTFFMSRAAIFGTYLPLGLSAVAGAQQSYTVSCAVGALIGYFIPSSGSGIFKYITAVFAIASIKWLLLGAVKLKSFASVFALIGFISTLATGFAMLLGDPTPTAVITVFIEAMLVFACSYFISRAIPLGQRLSQGLSSQETAILIIAVNLVLASFVPVGFKDISFGRALLILLTVSVGKYGGASVGAVAGTSSAFVLVLLGGECAGPAMPLAAAGLLSGVFAPAGRIGSAVSAIMTFALWAFLPGESIDLAPLIESVAAAAVFMLLPSKAGNMLVEFFAPASHLPKDDGLRRSVVMRLGFAADTMRQVSGTVERVSVRLSQMQTPSSDDIIRRTRYEVCVGCSLSSACWGSGAVETEREINLISKSGGEAVNNSFAEKCLRSAKLQEAVRKYTAEYTSRVGAQNRLQEVRTIVTDQFDGIANMLGSLSKEFEMTNAFDTEKAAEITASLKRRGIVSSECSVATDKYGRIGIEIKIKDRGKIGINRRDVLSIAEQICEREFDPPSLIEGNGEYLLSLCEKANFTVDYGVCQYCAEEGRLCGDAFEYWNDGKGRSYMVISDGMGSGGRAALDGAMGVELISALIKAGFGFDSALKTVNSAMLFKSTDESFATLDIVCLDLFTGKADIYKAGAAPTLIRRGSKTTRAACTSLPAGILQDVGFEHTSLSISGEDILVMISDGAACDGTDWICAEIEAWRVGNAEKLAIHLADAARKRQGESHRDDITVLTAILHKTA